MQAKLTKWRVLLWWIVSLILFSSIYKKKQNAFSFLITRHDLNTVHILKKIFPTIVNMLGASFAIPDALPPLKESSLKQKVEVGPRRTYSKVAGVGIGHR